MYARIPGFLNAVASKISATLTVCLIGCATPPRRLRLALRDAANAKSVELQHIVEQAYSQIRTDPRMLASKRFLLGWSFGGAWATYAAGVLPDVTGVVAYYGQAFTDDPALYQKVEAPILFIGGHADSRPPPQRLQSIVQTLQSEGKSAEPLLVPAGPGQRNDLTP